jgi:carboxypeptidase Taq
LSRQFWRKYWKVITDTFPQLRSVSEKNAYRAVNKLDFNNLIRIEADEVTYPMHVIIRFEIERDLFENRLEVKDIPKRWNSLMKEYLGIVPKNDAEGVLQDVHWSDNSWGYFPTYVFGAMYAAQIASVPAVDKYIKQGNYKAISEWLKKEIHNRGSVTMNADELLKRATGEPLNTKYFVNYIKRKYSKLYF